MVVANYDRKNLYEQARPYLRDPVQKRIYAKKQQWLLDLPMAGSEALYTLGKTTDREFHPVRAIEKKIYLEHAEKIESIDPAWDTRTDYVELEVWRYDPDRFTQESIVDSLSLALSLKGEQDEAMKLNINKLLMQQ